jgi:hypothetical protein
MKIRRRRRWPIVLTTIPVAYFAIAYILLPALWSHHEHEPGLAVLPMVTRTGSGIPGDALNVGLVGSKDDICRAMASRQVVSGRPNHAAHELRSHRQRGP